MFFVYTSPGVFPFNEIITISRENNDILHEESSVIVITCHGFIPSVASSIASIPVRSTLGEPLVLFLSSIFVF